MSEATARPWDDNYGVIIDSNGHTIVRAIRDDDEGIANAALIVKAVNAHDSLVAALDRLMITGSAATGRMMCEFSDMHKYIEQIMGRPVFTHEMGIGSVAKEIGEKAEVDFVAAIKAAQAALDEVKP